MVLSYVDLQQVMSVNNKNLQCMLSDYEEARFLVNPDKLVSPTTVFEFLCIIIDTHFSYGYQKSKVGVRVLCCEIGMNLFVVYDFSSQYSQISPFYHEPEP